MLIKYNYRRQSRLRLGYDSCVSRPVQDWRITRSSRRSGREGWGRCTARGARLDRCVAVKVLAEGLANEANALARFEREAKALAALSHPNLVPIFDVGTDHAISFAVMELLVGETLLACLGRGSQSSIPSRFPRRPRTGAATGSAALPLHHAE